ncbi:MAG: chorismate synthase [Bacteroidales bacterium]|nr:chorismate synthase [Bacteroidales bacterium]
MAANTFGHILRLTTFGESHGVAIGGVLDGFPSGIRIDFNFIDAMLRERRPGSKAGSTQRREADEVEFLSGIAEGVSLGTPIAFLIRNKDKRSKDYSHLKDLYRPSHADYTYQSKYGIRDHKGGGRASARETVARVVGGALAQQLLWEKKVDIAAWVSRIGVIQSNKQPTREEIEVAAGDPLYCPDQEASQKMKAYLDELRQQGDSAGGIISCSIIKVPAGWGEPVFDKLHADLGKAMLSINAVKGFEYGSGFSAASMQGSRHADEFYYDKAGNNIRTRTNYSGGIQGGISNGEEIFFNVAFKPVSSIGKQQQTVDKKGKSQSFQVQGRHDVCVVPRAVPIVKAMAALVLADHYLLNKRYS